MDIVEWLRGMSDMLLHEKIDPRHLKEAADEIELLRKERDGLREALDDMIRFVRNEYGSNDVIVQRAEAALKGYRDELCN